MSRWQFFCLIALFGFSWAAYAREDRQAGDLFLASELICLCISTPKEKS